MCFDGDKCLGSIVSKLEDNKKQTIEGPIVRKRGYIAMLSVEPEYRKLGIGR